MIEREDGRHPCPGVPLGSCLTIIEAERELCGYCTRTRELARP